MKALDVVIRDRIAPPLTDAGFKRRGRLFTLTTPAGDQASVHVQEFKLGVHEAEFHVDLHVLPKIWDEFMARDGGKSNFVGLWRDRLPASELDHLWAFNLDNHAEGERLTAAVRGVIPEMTWLLEPAHLLDYARLPLRQSSKVNPRRENVLALLLAAQGPSDELEEQLRKLGTDPQWAEFDAETTTFIRRRLSSSA